MALTPSEIAIPHFDRLINEFGRDCQLIFTSGKTPCTNCILDLDTKRSTGVYNETGPEDFEIGETCPVCLGEGLIGSNSTETIKMNIKAEPKLWVKKLPYTINVSEHAVMATTFVWNVPKILKARRTIIFYDLLGINKYEYFLAGEPFDSNHIVQGRYLSMVWDRTGGT